ncbi:exported hypothetical protein [uncultured delta proteobacterium]|uniref:Uncharacterized protein n=1 Tax=uncultured delta proteobacterium TaxID=34034 RepID=A0A212JXW1_9DELT|nr:exported hypothetical protein [uncultured delta proteobacterium]
MSQRKIVYLSRLRTCLRLLTPFLYSCLILSLTWYESSPNLSTSITATPTAVAKHLDVHAGFAVSQGKTSRHLPSLLAPVTKLPSSARLRPENRDNGNEPPLFQPYWAIASDTPYRSSRRIDPIAWESRTPSFLLPSAYGLVPFAIPPPVCLV